MPKRVDFDPSEGGAPPRTAGRRYFLFFVRRFLGKSSAARIFLFFAEGRFEKVALNSKKPGWAPGSFVAFQPSPAGGDTRLNASRRVARRASPVRRASRRLVRDA